MDLFYYITLWITFGALTLIVMIFFINDYQFYDYAKIFKWNGTKELLISCDNPKNLFIDIGLFLLLGLIVFIILIYCLIRGYYFIIMDKLNG